ncbi:hypothetical protein PISMIDRAFT_14496 [Pisolithus microcarpus 441]|uniref:Uncharacterized protein n=1 Tax=Pisolithus microcarpus 441 TaxID=765257 RepID=A0A0C9Y0H3_9AGAM|nr:hypothetical protein PISMIDRAFT_14496 [Pisolithus microcarpus 441]
MLKNCPTRWREPSVLDILAQITRLYKREVHVDLNVNDPFLVFQFPEIMSLMFYMNY